MPAVPASLRRHTQRADLFHGLSSLFLDMMHRRRSCPCAPEAPTSVRTVAQQPLGGSIMYYGQVEGTDLVVLDKRFAKLFAGYMRVTRHWTGSIWAEGPAWFAPAAISSGRTSPTTGCCASSRNRAVRLPAGLQQFERQHCRQPGPAGHLRTSDSPRHPHRVRRLDQGARGQVGGQAFQLAERCRREIGRFRSGSPTRPTASTATTRASRRRPRSTAATSIASTDRRGHEADRQYGAAERPRFLARRETPLRRRYRRHS